MILSMLLTRTLMFWQQVGVLLWKEARAETRTRERFVQMFAFAVLMIVIFQVAVSPGTPWPNILPGVLWMIFTFSGILGLNHSFRLEFEHDGLQGLMLCPIPRSVIYLGKMLGNAIVMLLTEAVLLPLFIVLFNLPPGGYLIALGCVIILGTMGLAIIGTLFAAMTATTRVREVLLPLLVLPLEIPLLIAAVKSTGKILAQNPWSEIAFELQFLLVFDLLFLGIALLTFDYIIESE